jgi:signal transduction histidine kinase
VSALVLVPALVLAAAVIVGAAGAAGAAEQRLPFVLTVADSHTWGEETVPWVADMDGDGCDELIGANETTGAVCPIRLVEKTWVQTGQINVPVRRGAWDPFTFVGTEDVDDDGADEFLVSCVIRDTLHLFCYGPGGGIERDAVILHGEDREGDPGWDGRVREVRRVDLGGGRHALAVAAGADGDGVPRAVILFDSRLEREISRFEGGTQLRVLRPADLDGDGREEIVFASAGPGNAGEVNGTRGERPYAGALAVRAVEQGAERLQLLWLHEGPADYTDALVAVGDLTGDGRPEVVCATTPGTEAVTAREGAPKPVVSPLWVWDGATGDSLGGAAVPQRIGMVFVGKDREGRGVAFASTRSGGLHAYRFEEGRLVETASAEVGAPADAEACVEIEGVRGSCLLVGTSEGGLWVYDAGLRLLASHRPAREPLFACARFLGLYRESEGVTRLVGVSDRAYLLALERAPMDWALLGGRAIGLLGLAWAAGYATSRRVRDLTQRRVVRPVLSRLTLTGADRRRSELALLELLEMGGHDKSIVTRPLRRLVDTLTMAEGAGAPPEQTAELARSALASHAESGRPGIVRILEIGGRMGALRDPVRTLDSALTELDRALSRLETALAAGRVDGMLTREIARRTEALEQALARLRETVGEPYGADAVAGVRDALEQFAPDLSAAGVAVETDLSSVDDGYAWIAPADLLYVVGNLVSNAVRAMRSSAARRLGVSGETSGGFVVLRFTDTGCGIAAADRERLFTLGGTTKEGEGGTGLYRSVQLLKSLGGRLDLERSEPGKGSTFVLHLRRKARPAPGA